MTREAPAYEAPTYPEYQGLRLMAEESVRLDGGTVDPVKIRRYAAMTRGADWRFCVLGHNRAVSLVDMHMLLLADGQGIVPSLPAWLVEVREQISAREQAAREAWAARVAALDGEWERLRKALTIPVVVAYNYSGPNHLEGWSQGADHILLVEGFHAGRLHREAGQSLCWTQSRAKHLLFTADQVDRPDGQRPTCKACLRHASRLAGGVDVSALLSQKVG